MKHALVIGGTGMLAKVSLWLAKEGFHTTVLARNRQRLQKLKNQIKNDSLFTELCVDYTNYEQLREGIENVIKKNGPIDLVVSWIHGTAPQAPDIVNEIVSKTHPGKYRFFHVRGSASALESITNPVHVPKNCLYRQVQLGFVIEKNRSRWLTHDEISNGVIEAIKNDREKTVVGTLEPWELRP
jgi:hypothetical protein